MLLQVILEGLGLGILLVLVCAVGIRKGAVGMVHLYSPAVQQRCGQQIGFAQIVQFQFHGRCTLSFAQDGEALPAWYHRVVTDLLQGGGDAQTIVQFGALFHLIDPLDGARSVTI